MTAGPLNQCLGFCVRGQVGGGGAAGSLGGQPLGNLTVRKQPSRERRVDWDDATEFAKLAVDACGRLTGSTSGLVHRDAERGTRAVPRRSSLLPLVLWQHCAAPSLMVVSRCITTYTHRLIWSTLCRSGIYPRSNSTEDQPLWCGRSVCGLPARPNRTGRWSAPRGSYDSRSWWDAEIGCAESGVDHPRWK
jgi:hypothetical protein